MPVYRNTVFLDFNIRIMSYINNFACILKIRFKSIALRAYAFADFQKVPRLHILPTDAILLDSSLLFLYTDIA